MVTVYILIIAFLIYFVVRVLSRRRVEEVPVAFAGAYNGGATCVKLSVGPNPIIYTEGEKRVNLDKCIRYVISGHSLERVGIDDGMFVYTVAPAADVLSSIEGKFVIFRYDNERLVAEHPDITDPVESYKARKVVAIVPSGVTYEQFTHFMYPLLSNDTEIDGVDECMSCLWSKYEFASRFYHEDKSLIVSITYKDSGRRKDYSFHSAKFLVGVIKYRSA